MIIDTKIINIFINYTFNISLTCDTTFGSLFPYYINKSIKY